MYRTNIRPFHERKELIEQGTHASKDTHPFYEYQNKRTDLPLIRIAMNVPIYRMANYRTRTAQLKYIHEHRKTQDFFSAGQENESAQQAQHDILVVFAKQGRALSVSPIIEELESEGQREPLIITAGGLVVNGNRRLAAMRELLTERPAEFRNFSHVDCAVLPDNVTSDEIREIEVCLQMRPETKLPYEWVVESIAIQELRQSGKSIDHIASLMKKKKKDVERAERALIEADIYLKEWLHEPGEYQYVEEAEQLFNDLAKALEGKQGEALEISRRIAWALASNSKNLKRRIYDYNFSFGKRTDEVISVLVDRLGIDLAMQGEETKTDSGGLDIILEDEQENTSLDPLIEILDDPIQRQTATDELISICESLLEQNRQGEIGRRALASVQGANNKLQEVDLTKADPATYDSIGAQLDSVIQHANRLKEKLQYYNKGDVPSK